MALAVWLIAGGMERPRHERLREKPSGRTFITNPLDPDVSTT
jgi:hypothetical protein